MDIGLGKALPLGQIHHTFVTGDHLLACHSIYTDFAPPRLGVWGGAQTGNTVEVSVNVSDRSLESTMGGRGIIGRTLLDAFVPPVTHRTRGISILHPCLHCSRRGKVIRASEPRTPDASAGAVARRPTPAT